MPAPNEVRFDALDEVTALFDAVSPKLLRIALRLSGNLNDAEDLIQQTFLTAIEKGAQFESGRSVEAWLVGIMVKHHRYSRRRESRRVDPHRLDTSFAASAEEVASLLERETLLNQEVGQLPEPYRNVVELFFLEGLDQAEIAERVSRPKSTVSTQINRGLERLRKRLPESAALSALLSVGLGHAVAAARTRLLEAATKLPIATTALGTRILRPLAIGAAVLVTSASAWFIIASVSAPPSTPAGAPAAASARSGTATPGAAADSTADPRRAVPDRTDRDTSTPIATGTTQSVQVLDPSGRPVAGTPIRLVVDLPDTPTPFAPRSATSGTLLSAITDADGVARFPNLSAGTRTAVVFDDGGSRSDTFLVSTTMRVFTVPVMPIEGTVTDGEANPIADAAIHLSASPGALPGFLAARTDERGHFEATALKFDSTVSLWATKAGFGNSEHYDLEFVTTKSVRNVTLSRRTYVVGGIVRGPDGRPLPDCTVALHSNDRRGDSESFSRTRTDENGQFQIVAPIGHTCMLAVRPEEHAPAQVSVTPQQPWVDVQVARAARLHGTVLDEQRRPVSNVVVGVYPQLAPGALRPVFVDIWQLAQSADGRFAFDHAPIGEVVTLVVRNGGIATSATLDLQSGESFEWNPEIDLRKAVAGRVLDASGQPMAGGELTLEPIRDGPRPFYQGVPKDARGMFRADGLEADRHRIHLFHEKRPTGAWAEVRRGDTKIEWQVPDISSQSMRGRVVFTGFEQHDENITVYLTPKPSWYRLSQPVRSDGTFVITHLAAGEYAVEAILENDDRHLGWHLGDYALDPGQTLELPLAVVPATGTLIVDTVPQREPGGFTLSWMQRPDCSFTFWIRDPHPQGGTQGTYTPGAYVMTLCIPGFAVVRRPVTIRSGAETRIRVPLEPTRMRELGLVVDGSRTLRFQLSVQLVVHRDGKLLLDSVIDLHQSVNDIPLGLAPGAYTVRAMTPWGARGDAEFVVPEGEDPKAPPIRIDIPVR